MCTFLRHPIDNMRNIVHPAGMRVTGFSLKVERLALGVRAYQVAQELSAHPSTVSRMESRSSVTAEQAQRYREALARCATVAAQPDRAA